jgi:superfamily I DNA/RNA helicase
LFYVALTRAEKHLTISYAKFKEDGKEMEASRFIIELKTNHTYFPSTAMFFLHELVHDLT